MKEHILNILISGKIAMRMILIMGGLLLLSQQEVKATHIVGGHLTYRCLGNNLYEIRLTLRRDCLQGASNAQFDDPAAVGFFDATTFQPVSPVGSLLSYLEMSYNDDDTLNQTFVSDCTIAGNEVCVHQTTYVDTVNLPFRATGYIMAYQRCCRNGSVLNIINPLNTGMTILAEMSGDAQLACKSSPQIGLYPPIYICVNKDIHYFPNSTDIDGDSLGFSLETPYAGGNIINNQPQPPPPPPYDLVNWRPPYSLDNIMGGIPLAIDPVTGEITGTPNTIGQFVITIVITSYRDGRELAQTRVDFQYNVRACRDVPVADFTSPGLNCEGLTMGFTNLSENADEYLWIFDSDDPNSATSDEENPTYTYEQEGFYDVTLIVRDSEMICFDTIVQQIGVFTSENTADFSYGSTSCTEEVVLDFTDLSINPEYPIVGWEWLLTYPEGVLASTDQNPTFIINADEPATVFVVLIVTDINGCTASEAKSFQVQEFGINFNPDADSICVGESVQLLIGGDCSLTYTWEPPNGIDTDPPCDPTAYPGISVTYYVTVTDGVCVLNDSIHVGVQQLNLDFTYETDCKSLDVQFINNSTNGVGYFWDFGVPNLDTDTTSIEDPAYTYPQEGEYIVTLSSLDGCSTIFTDTVTVNIIQDLIPEQVVNCFEESVFLNPGFNPDYTYIWSPGEFLEPDSTSANPLATVTEDTWFYVTVTEASLPGCQIVDSVLLAIPDEFDISAGSDITVCDFDPVTLTAVVTGNQNVDVIWYDDNGIEVGTGLVISVTPELTQVYIVIATDTLGCSKSDTITVLKPEPTFDVVIAPTDTVYCYIQTVTLTAVSIVGVTYEWYNANGELIGTGNTIDVTPGTESCYHVIGTDLLGCQASDTVCLTPTYFDINISADGEDFCFGTETTLSVNAIDGVTYEWFNSNNDSIGSGLSVNVSPLVPECFYVVGADALGCEDTDTICLNPIDVNLEITGDNGICLGEETTLSVNGGQDYTYIWDPTGSTNSSIVVSPDVTTTYSVTVTSVPLGCLDTLSYTVEVFSFNPAISITATPDSVILTETSQLEVNQDPDYQYEWSASTGEIVPPIYNPVVTPTGSTTYCVTVTDFNGCTGTACISVGVADPFCDERDIFLPNAFTPDNNGENDVLYVRSNFVETMELNIYNRWGEKVFTSLDINVGWDGTFNGQLLSPDVFGFYLNVMCPNGETYFKKGNITLLH